MTDDLAWIAAVLHTTLDADLASAVTRRLEEYYDIVSEDDLAATLWQFIEAMQGPAPTPEKD